jgi:hypothetical protein
MDTPIRQKQITFEEALLVLRDWAAAGKMVVLVLTFAAHITTLYEGTLDLSEGQTIWYRSKHSSIAVHVSAYKQFISAETGGRRCILMKMGAMPTVRPPVVMFMECAVSESGVNLTPLINMNIN